MSKKTIFIAKSLYMFAVCELIPVIRKKPLPCFFTLMMLRNASWNAKSGSFGAKLIWIGNLGGISAVAKRRLHFLYLVENFARIALSSMKSFLGEVLKIRCIS